MIGGYDRFNDLMTAFRTKAEKIDLAKGRQVAKEPFVTGYLKGIASTLSAGYVDTGKAVSTTLSVTVVRETASIKTCLDLTPTKLVSQGSSTVAPVQNPPPSRVTVSMVKEADAWRVSGLKGGEVACVSG